jgi:hypothetical protein
VVAPESGATTACIRWLFVPGEYLV